MSFFVAKTQHLTLQYEMLYKLKATRLDWGPNLAENDQEVKCSGESPGLLWMDW